MKNLITIALVALAFAASGATYYPPVTTDTNGVLRSTNFFGANMGQLTNALNSAGFAPGGGTGNADTNNANAWAQKQTFLGDVLMGSTNLYDKLSSLDSGKANADSDLDALAGLALTGVMARTGAATYALRTLTGDSEVTITNGDGVAGNPTFSLASGITRDSELSAAISALSSVYQEDDADLAAYAALATSGLVARTGSGTVAARTLTGDTEIVVANGDGVSGNPTLSIGAAIARVAAVAAGYQPLATALTRLAGIGSGASGDVLIRDAVGFTNLAKSTDGKVLKLVAGLPAWADDETGNVDTNSPNTWSQIQTFTAGIDASTGTNELGVLRVSSIESDAPIGQSIGGTGGTNAASARAALGLTIGYDVQAYDANLAQLATVGWASGDMPWFDGSNLTNLATTAAGRTLLAAANAAAQWSALLSSALQSGAYDSGTWNGVTDKAITPDQFRDVIVALPGGSNAVATVTPPLYLSNGVLTLDTDGLGGGGSGYTYIVTNVNGAFQSRTASTNWVVMSATVSSNYAPAATGKFLEGGYGLVLSNNSGSIGNLNMRIKANGTIVFQDAPASITTGTLRAAVEDFRIIRSSDTTAAIVSVGAYVNPAASIGLGDFGGGSPLGNAKAITNIAWNWATNNTLVVSVDCDTSTSTNDALGMSVAHAYLRAEGASGGGGGTGDVVGPASATDDNIATFDGTTGKLIQDGGVSVSSLATEAEVAAAYQAKDTDLDDLADGSLSGSKVGSGIDAGNVTTGTLSSNRLPADVAFTSMAVGTISATSVTGDASGLTNLNGSNIASGTVAAARIDSAIARLASPALTGTPTVNGTNFMALIASSGGGGGLTLIDGSAITNVNLRSSYAIKASVSSVTNVDWVPQPVTTASTASLTPAFGSSRGHEFTLTNNATLNAPSGVTSAMVGDTFRLVFIQDATGNRTVTTATNYLFGSDITGLTLTTNAGARDYMVLYVRRTDVFDVIGFVRGYAQ